MFEREIRLHGFMHGLLQRLLTDMDEATFQRPLCDGANSPAWISAHLAVANDYALRTVGGERVAPAEWHKRFHPGASPKNDSAPLPSKAEVLETLEVGRRRIAEAVNQADPEKLKQPHNAEILKNSPLKTLGDVMDHLLTTHFAFHVGQISAMRRLDGKAFLF